MATHIVGGELNYRYLGNNLYEIKLTVYRDCYYGIPPFDNPASVGIFDAFNNLVAEILLTFPGSDTIPPTINSPCFIPPTNICYEQTTYVDTVTLPSSPQGYQLAYQRCCRNVTILNIIQPEETGATYYASIPGTSTFSQNSNPVFNNWPPPFICRAIPFVFDHSATDYDGDSIVYQLCTPLNGADDINPIPQPPNPPPYLDILWQPPYSESSMLGNGPVIDPVTGQFSVTPQTTGQFVVGVCATEYRNGIYVGFTRRDFQLNVVNCPTLVVAAMQNPIINCKTFDVFFENFSLNAATYLWDFGVTGSSTDISTDFQPSFTYPDTGTYTVTLIAYSGINPGCADTVTSTVTILPEYEAFYRFELDTCTNTVSFFDSSNSISGLTSQWLWDFGDGSTDVVSNPVHAYQPGNYTVTLYATSSRGCPDTIISQLTIPELLSVDNITITNVRCFSECNGMATALAQNGQQPYQYQWNDPQFQVTPSIDSLCPGNYQVIVTDQNGCSDTSSIIITEPPVLNASATATLDYCEGACIGTATVIPAGGNGNYQYLWNDVQQQVTPTAINLCDGNYTVTVTDIRGCTDSVSVQVIYSDSIPSVSASADDTLLFEGQSTYLHADPSSGYTYSWSPVSGMSGSTTPAPQVSPISTTTYTVTITDANNCVNQDSVTIYIREVLCDEPEIFIPSAFSPNNDQVNDILYVRGNTIESMKLVIYDRWGEKVFETSDIRKGWDGKFKDVAVAPGVFGYYIELKCYNGETYTKQGNITVIR